VYFEPPHRLDQQVRDFVVTLRAAADPRLDPVFSSVGLRSLVGIGLEERILPSLEAATGELERYIELGCRKLIVDCTRLTHISSYGLGVLIRLHKKLATKGGDVKLANVSGAVPKILSMTRLNKIFEIYPTLDDARQAFRQG